MPLLLLIFFGIYGWIEFEAFIAIGNAVGGLVTFLGIFVTAFIGVALMKHQGTWVLKQWQSSISEGEMNTPTLASGASLVLGAVLMLLPGYVTDFIGLLCFIPILRVLIGQSLLSRLGGSTYSTSLFANFSSQFRSKDDFSTSSYENTKRKRPPSYSHQKPLEGELIEGQYESRDAPKK
jgi:UPF0716 protein FxsA